MSNIGFSELLIVTTAREFAFVARERPDLETPEHVFFETIAGSIVKMYKAYLVCIISDVSEVPTEE